MDSDITVKWISDTLRDSMIKYEITENERNFKYIKEKDFITVKIKCKDPGNSRKLLLNLIMDTWCDKFRQFLDDLYPKFNVIFLSSDWIQDCTEVIYKFKITQNYLNLNNIPSDILYEIIKHIDKNVEYDTLVEVSKLKFYPELYEKLSLVLLGSRWGAILTLTDKANISIMYYEYDWMGHIYNTVFDQQLNILYELKNSYHVIYKDSVDKYGLPFQIRKQLLNVPEKYIKYV